MLEGSVAEHLGETENLPHPTFVMSTKRKMIQEDSDYM